MASSSNQRHNVVSPMEATRPRRKTSRLRSGMLYRERGSPASTGSSQANLLMATTTLGGKAGGPPTPGLLIQPVEPLFEEAFAPLRDNLPRRVQTSRDLIVSQSGGCVEDDLGSNDIPIR